MKLGKLLGMKGSILPKLKIMPKATDLTGIRMSELGLPSMKLKKSKGKSSIFKTLKDV